MRLIDTLYTCLQFRPESLSLFSRNTVISAAWLLDEAQNTLTLPGCIVPASACPKAPRSRLKLLGQLSGTLPHLYLRVRVPETHVFCLSKHSLQRGHLVFEFAFLKFAINPSINSLIKATADSLIIASQQRQFEVFLI